MKLNISLTNQQKEVLHALISWWKKKDSTLTLGGYAGTGKTTLLAVFRKMIHVANPRSRVAFCAYTGKAAQVLATKIQREKIDLPQDSVGTIHSLIYAPISDDAGRILWWKKKNTLAIDLIIVDEASMVDEQLWRDLCSYHIPILAVGDHGQLPPVGQSFNLMAQPELVLTDIHRQASNNPIIKVSMQAREMGQIPVGEFGGKVKKLLLHDHETGEEVAEILQNWSRDWLVLVGYNWTRIKLNREIRMHRGFENNTPRQGDVVICLKNNWQKNIYNGMTGTIDRLIPVEHENGKVMWFEAEIQLESGELYTGTISSRQFNQPQTQEEVEGITGKAMGDLFDFGYVLTVHKSQGSEAESVLLFEERNQYMTDDDWARWLYTAVTRARERLVIVGR